MANTVYVPFKSLFLFVSVEIIVFSILWSVKETVASVILTHNYELRKSKRDR